MLLHLARMIAIIALIVACIFLPFLPGGYDAFAVTLSAMAQGVGFLSLLLVPIGIAWLIYEFSKRAPQDDAPSHKGYYFALAGLIAGAIVLGVAFGFGH